MFLLSNFESCAPTVLANGLYCAAGGALIFDSLRICANKCIYICIWYIWFVTIASIQAEHNNKKILRPELKEILTGWKK